MTGKIKERLKVRGVGGHHLKEILDFTITLLYNPKFLLNSLSPHF